MKSRKMKSTMIPVFIFLINFRNETMLVKQKVMGVFEKNVKTCLQNQKVYLMLWPFSSDFNFASKHGGVTATTCKYCPLVVGPTVTNCCKKLHLKYSRIPRTVF